LSWGMFLDSQHFKGRKACWSSRMGLGRVTSSSIIHADQNGSPNIPKIGTHATLGAHNFVCRPPIEVRFERKFVALVKSFPTIFGTPLARKTCRAILNI
jgi:hypothetical protein